LIGNGLGKLTALSQKSGWRRPTLIEVIPPPTYAGGFDAASAAFSAALCSSSVLNVNEQHCQPEMSHIFMGCASVPIQKVAPQNREERRNPGFCLPLAMVSILDNYGRVDSEDAALGGGRGASRRSWALSADAAWMNDVIQRANPSSIV
jgi:hypothetical protein